MGRWAGRSVIGQQRGRKISRQIEGMRAKQAGDTHAEIPVGTPSTPGRQVAGQTYRWAGRQKSR